MISKKRHFFRNADIFPFFRNVCKNQERYIKKTSNNGTKNDFSKCRGRRYVDIFEYFRQKRLFLKVISKKRNFFRNVDHFVHMGKTMFSK